MDARAQSTLLLSIVSLSLSIAVLLRPSRPRLHSAFAAVSLAAFAWSTARLCEQLFGSAIWTQRMAALVEAALPAIIPPFFLLFLSVPETTRHRTGRPLLVISAVLGVVALTPLGVWRDPASATIPFRVAMGIYAYLACVVTASLVWARMRRSTSRTERARLLYLWVGAAVAIGLVGIDILTTGLPTPPLGNAVVALYLYFLWQTLVRHRLLDLNELLGKLLVLSLLAIMLATIYGLLVSWGVGTSSGHWAGPFLFNTVVASFVMLILFDPVRTRVEGAVVQWLFRERREFSRVLELARRRMGAQVELNQVIEPLLDALHESRRVTHASFYLLTDDGTGFRRRAHRGPAPAARIDAATARALVEAARQGQRAVLLEDVERQLESARSRAGGESPSSSADSESTLGEIGVALGAMRAGVCLPLAAGERVAGFLNIHDDRVAEAYSSDELAVLIALAEQLARQVEQSRLVERLKERDRLAALGEMAAGLAHEIRNPLSSIRGAVQFIDPEGLPSTEREFLEVIIEEVDRLNGVVTQFLDYARPLRFTGQATAVDDLLARTVRLLQTREIPATIEVEFDRPSNIPLVMCDPDQLKQVFINLVINAVQAMPQGGRLSLEVRALQFGWNPDATRVVDQVEIRVEDSGGGIPDEVKDRLFIPFFTTKQKGTGLGLALCQRIVKHHGGTLEVENHPGRGAAFVVRLPVGGPSDSRVAGVTTESTASGRQLGADDRTPMPEALRPSADLTGA